MLKYILKRILVFIPTLIIICFIAFIINNAAPGDPVSRLLQGETEKPENRNFYEWRYRQLKHQLGLDLPLFYFSVVSIAEPDTLMSIANVRDKRSLLFLINQFGNWEYINGFHQSLIRAKNISGKLTETKSKLELIAQSNNTNQIDFLIDKLNQDVKSQKQNDFALQNELTKVIQNWNSVKENSQRWKCWIPFFRFHSNNQFHRWLLGDGNPFTGEHAVFTKGIIRGDFGKSYVTGKSVGLQLLEKTKWTMFFSLASIFLAYLISIPIGVIAGSNSGLPFDRWSSNILALLYSLPAFFLATLLLMLFANPGVFNWFPASGVAPIEGYAENSSFIQKLTVNLPYIILPLICYTYGSLAFLARAVRSEMKEEMHKEYILTAKAKGLTYQTVTWQHAFRNALFPLITIIAYVFPAMIGGSAILETIFSIPGLGLEIVNSIYNQDYPIIVAVFLITGLLTMIGYLFSDILYAWADPRIKLN